MCFTAGSLRRTARFVATSLKYCSAVYAIMKTQEVTEYMFGLAVAPRRAAGGSRSTEMLIKVAGFASIIDRIVSCAPSIIPQ